MKQKWKVGELATLTGLTVRTLRYYDQIGLFSPSDHSDSGHRLYNEADITRLQQILSLKELGLSLEEVKSVLDHDQYTPLEIVSLQIDRLNENIRMQQNLVGELTKLANLMQAKESVSVGEFAKLMMVMKRTKEKFVIERRESWERHLDQLGDFLANEHDEEPNLRRKKQ